jgi:hypothetical protein
MIKRLTLLVLSVYMLCSSGPTGAADTFEYKQIGEIERSEFLTSGKARQLAIVLAFGDGRLDKVKAQNAGKLGLIEPNGCYLVPRSAIRNQRVWLMINNAPVDLDQGSAILDAKAEHYLHGASTGGSRNKAREDSTPTFSYDINADIDSDSTPEKRPVFNVNQVNDGLASDLVKFTVTTAGDGYLDKSSIAFVLIFKDNVIDEGAVPKCERGPLFQ